MLASMLLISSFANPVMVLLCFGLDCPGGPTGPWKSVMGADVDSVLSRGCFAVVAMSGYRSIDGRC